MKIRLNFQKGCFVVGSQSDLVNEKKLTKNSKTIVYFSFIWNMGWVRFRERFLSRGYFFPEKRVKELLVHFRNGDSKLWLFLGHSFNKSLSACHVSVTIFPEWKNMIVIRIDLITYNLFINIFILYSLVQNLVWWNCLGFSPSWGIFYWRTKRISLRQSYNRFRRIGLKLGLSNGIFQKCLILVVNNDHDNREQMLWRVTSYPLKQYLKDSEPN